MVAASKQSGFALVTTVLIVSTMVLLVIYVISFTITELKISNSQASTVQAYYLAESGMAEAIWRLKNDETWKDGFENNSSWEYTYTKNSALYPDGSYEITITNSGLAQGEIVSIGKLTVGGFTTQRAIKTSVYKAIGATPIEEIDTYADGNIVSSTSIINVYDGGIFANGNIEIKSGSVVNSDGNVTSTGNIIRSWDSTINAPALIENADPILMPAISFDDESDPNSYINQATVIYTENEFEDLLDNDHNLVLPGPITYVSGNVEIYGINNLTINGALVTEGRIEIGKVTSLCCYEADCGYSDIVINREDRFSPAGILSKDRIDFEACLNSFNATGLIYANDKINILSIPGTFDLNGSTVSRKLTITSLWQGINITKEREVVASTLGEMGFAPIITVDHWEEEY
jgi:hypothetical protein